MMKCARVHSRVGAVSHAQFNSNEFNSIYLAARRRVVARQKRKSGYASRRRPSFPFRKAENGMRVQGLEFETRIEMMTSVGISGLRARSKNGAGYPKSARTDIHFCSGPLRPIYRSQQPSTHHPRGRWVVHDVAVLVWCMNWREQLMKRRVHLGDNPICQG